jgi:tripartite-type tricarboxylate transporter receptor subunit TctC
MKKLILLLFVLISLPTWSSELIKIQTPYTASHSGTPGMLRIIEQANKSQSDYTFILEFRPGGNQIIAVKQMDVSPNNNLAIIAASFVENVESRQLRQYDYVPVYSLGDACWAVLSTSSNGTAGIASLKNTPELIVGTVGFGNATHLTSLLIGEKFNIPVKLVPFKSNYDAVVNMVGNNGVNFGIDKPEVYENFKDKNKDMRMLAVSCSKRFADYPNVLTLKEQGITAPSVLNIVVANIQMPKDKRIKLGEILTKATTDIGEIEIKKISGFVPPQFIGITAQQHFDQSISLIKDLRQKFNKEIVIAK